MKVFISRSAEADIEEITLGLADHNLNYAVRFERDLRGFIYSLDLFPNRYPALEAEPRLRRAQFGYVSVIYSVIESQQVVWVERITR